MSTQMERLVIELLALPTASRALLANQLLASLDEDNVPEISAEWLAEIDRRDAQIRDGSVQCEPAEDVMRRARERVK
jgi:putative addiction module component (TIGR02574 family)